MAQLSIHPLMSIVRNTVVLRNAALRALVVLALFECNGFVAVRYDIKGVFCKENRSNTLRTSRIHVHSRLHGPTRPVRGRLHGRVTCRAYGPCTRTFTEPCTGRVHGPCIRLYTGRVHGLVYGA